MYFGVSVIFTWRTRAEVLSYIFSFSGKKHGWGEGQITKFWEHISHENWEIERLKILVKNWNHPDINKTS